MPKYQFSQIPIKRILIRSANWVGDAVMTTPALQAVREHFPLAHITLLAKPWVMPVFENNPHIDHLMVYDRLRQHKGPLGLLRLAGELRRMRYDMAILLQNAFEAALIAWIAGIPNRLGFTTDGRTILLNHRMRSWPALKKGHLVDYYLGLLAEAGIRPPQTRRLSVYLIENERYDAERYLKDLGIPVGQLLIGINPGATYGSAKRWPAESFIGLSRRFIDVHGARVLVFGGPGETDLGARIASAAGPGCVNLCNQTKLRQAMALISLCRIFITNDSGLMHVAAALNIPTVAVIGPTDVSATSPINPSSILVQDKESCPRAPCLLPHCPIDHRCMKRISVDQVFDAAADLLQEGTQG